MNRFLFMCMALPLLGCEQSFFIRVDLSLDTIGTEALALNVAQMRELQVEAIPEDGTAPSSFTIKDDNLIDLLAAQPSYVLELPAELEGVPIKLVHKGFAVDPSITTPTLFGEITATTKQGEVNGVLLSIKDPSCDNTSSPADFCFSVSTSGPLAVAHRNLIATNTVVNNEPVVLLQDDDGATFRQFSVKADGTLTLVPAGNINFPVSGVSVQDLTLVDSNGGNFTIAVLQGAQISIVASSGVAGPSFTAPGIQAITAADLNLLGNFSRDIAGITGSTVEAFIANATDFDAPRSAPIPANLGTPSLIAARGKDVGVVTSGASANLILFDFFAGNLRQLQTIQLPAGTSAVAVEFKDLDNDGNQDAAILDNGPTKKLSILLLEEDGRLKTDGLKEVALNGNLMALSIGPFDNNGSLDFAVSGEAQGSFVQFVLSSGQGFLVTPPRITEQDPRVLVPVRIVGSASQADTLIVETTRVPSLDVFVPEI